MSWYREFFRGDYQRVYSFDDERSEREARFAANAVAAAPGARVLDLCCGEGRHLRVLRRLGLRAVGLDADAGSIAKARHGVRADMRALPFRSASFDAVVSLFSSYGYLESDDEDLRVLNEAARVLRPGGRVLIDLLNRDYALNGFVTGLQRVEEDETLIAEQRSWDALPGRLTVRFVIVEPDGRRTDSVGHTLRLYTLTELNRMLRAAGFRLIATYGGYDAGPLEIDSMRLICVAGR